MVVAFHAGLPVPGGFLGVDVFFVISGFVIASMLLRELAESGRVDLRTFYARRIRRLLPALSLVVAVTLVLAVLLPLPLGQPQETIKTAIGAMTVSANLVLERSVPGYFALSAKDNPLLHTWSLSVEEQFYLVFPAVMALAWSAARRWRPAVAAGLLLACCGLLSGVVVLAAHYGVPSLGASRNFLFFSAVTRSWEFIMGALLAFAWTRISLSRHAAAVLIVAGLACIAWSALTLTEQGLFPNWETLLPVGGTVLTIAGGGSPSLRRNPLALAPLTRLGDWSYSWYLWHWPFVSFASQLPGQPGLPLAAATLSLLPAALSYTFVEQPVRRSTRLGTRGSYTLLVALVIATLGVALIAERTVHFAWGQPWSMGAHAAMQRGCDEQPVNFEVCTWGSDVSRGSVLVVGDSQAWALADGVIASAQSLGLSTTVATMNGCPFMEPATAALLAGDACAASIGRTLDYIRRRKSNVLVIANSELYDARSLDGYRRLFTIMPPGPRHVVIVRQPPGGDPLSGRRSILVNLSGPNRTTPAVPPAPGLTAVLADLSGSADVLDPRETLCSGGICDVAADGHELYSNSNHLSVAGAMRLRPQLARSIEVGLRPAAR